jgi:hypothetical protein
VSWAPSSRLIRRTPDDADPNWALQYTLLDVSAMLTNATMRGHALNDLSGTGDAHLRAWWVRDVDQVVASNPRLYTEMIGPVNRKINEFALSDVARRVFGQPESTLDLSELLASGGVLLVDLAAGEIGRDIAALIGSLLVNLIAYQVFSRQASRDGAGPRRVLLVIDEFQAIPGANYALLLSELGKYGVQLVLGTQSLGVLNEVNREARLSWLANMSTLFAFRCAADDAETLAAELSIGAEDEHTVRAADINGLPDYACFVRTRGFDGDPAVFRFETRKADAGDAGRAEWIQRRSRERHGVDAALVDYWLAQAYALQQQGLPTRGQGPPGRAWPRRSASIPDMTVVAQPAQSGSMRIGEDYVSPDDHDALRALGTEDDSVVGDR